MPNQWKNGRCLSNEGKRRQCSGTSARVVCSERLEVVCCTTSGLLAPARLENPSIPLLQPSRVLDRPVDMGPCGDGWKI